MKTTTDWLSEHLVMEGKSNYGATLNMVRKITDEYKKAFNTKLTSEESATNFSNFFKHRCFIVLSAKVAVE